MHSIGGHTCERQLILGIALKSISNHKPRDVAKSEISVGSDPSSENVDVALKAVDVIAVNRQTGAHEFEDQELRTGRQDEIDPAVLGDVGADAGALKCIVDE